MGEKRVVRFCLQATDGSEVAFITDGIFTTFPDHQQVIFIEQTEMLLHTTVDIYPDQVILKRNGQIKMNMCFIVGKETEVEMETDFHFQIKMLCETFNIKNDSGMLEIIYQTELDKESQITHKLSLEWE